MEGWKGGRWEVDVEVRVGRSVGRKDVRTEGAKEGKVEQAQLSAAMQQNAERVQQNGTATTANSKTRCGSKR
jgi:hypothetical protein